MLAPPLGFRVLCHQLDPTSAACRVGAAEQGEGRITPVGGAKVEKRRVLGMDGKSGIEKQTAGARQVAESLQVGFAIQTRNRPCDILQDTAQPRRKLGKKLCLCPLLLRSFFFLLSIFL